MGPGYWGKTFFIWPPDPRGSDLDATNSANHANNGVQLKTLQETAGHASIATTAAYLHKTDNERHDEILASLNGTRTVTSQS